MARVVRLTAVLAVLAASAVEVLGARVNSYADDGAALTAEGDGGEDAAAVEADAPEEEVDDEEEEEDGTPEQAGGDDDADEEEEEEEADEAAQVAEVEQQAPPGEDAAPRNMTRTQRKWLSLVNLTKLANNMSLAHWEAVVAEEARGDVGTSGAWKWGVRHRVLEAMERQNVSDFPRPVHFWIPSFVGAQAAAERATQLPEFQAAKVVLVTDAGTRLFRKAVLEAGKLLVLLPWSSETTIHPRLLDPAKIDPSSYWKATRSFGKKAFGEMVNLTASLPRIDLVVLGSVAVSAACGARLGAGEGTNDFSYALLRELGAIGDGVPIITLVHDMQVVDDLPSDRMDSFDVPVDIICTPNATLRVEAPAEKPKGIMRELVQPYRFCQSAALRELKAKLEAETGVQFANATGSIRVPKPLTPFGRGRRGQNGVERKKRAGGNATRAQQTRSKRAGGNLERAARRRGGGNLTNATQRKGRKKGGVRRGNRSRANSTRGGRPARVKSPEEAEAAPPAAVE